MCEPMTIAMIATTALSTGMAMAAQKKQADAANASANYQANVAAINSQHAQSQADDARKRGAIAANEQREKTSRLIGKQRTIAAASGLSVSSGTTLDVFGETASMGEWDAQKILGNAEREAYGYETQSTNFMNKSNLARSKKVDPTMGMIATGLAGVSKVANTWSRYGG